MTENASVQHPTQLRVCTCCEHGQVWVECCNGSEGCPCLGKQVFFGQCRVCHGTGWMQADADTEANLRVITAVARATGGYIGNPHGVLR